MTCVYVTLGILLDIKKQLLPLGAFLTLASIILEKSDVLSFMTDISCFMSPLNLFLSLNVPIMNW